VLRLHYRGAGLPGLLATHVATILKDTPLGDLPVADLLSSKSYMVRAVQESWSRFLSRYGIQIDRASSGGASEVIRAVSVPFEHPDVRVLVDTMFLEGALQPVGVRGAPADLPGWIKVGLVEDPHALGSLVSEGAK